MPRLSISTNKKALLEVKKKPRMDRFKKILLKVQQVFPYANLKIELKLSDSSEIKKLNRQFRMKNKATDVLSFPMNSEDLLGVIIIDLITAQMQAKDYGHSLQNELEQLFVHGVLHLLGFDHHQANEAELMRQYEVFFCPQA